MNAGKIIGHDRKGRLIRKGDQIIMPNPSQEDIWSYGNFIATAIKNKIQDTIVVVDSEDNYFDVESKRVCLENDRYPIYCQEDLNNLPDGLYLALFHGFKNKEEREQYDDWGSKGPVIGPLEYVQTTYGSHIKILFQCPKDAEKYSFPTETINSLSIDKNGYIKFEDLSYGDCTVFNIKNKTSEERLSNAAEAAIGFIENLKDKGGNKVACDSIIKELKISLKGVRK